ncbi:MAG: 16S rRNA (cytosine(967)-C(5))-methyltransferase RsmB [Chthoniobacterales bacterium]
MSSRHLALAALRRWRTGAEFSDQVVGDLFSRGGLSAADRAFALELFYGALRNLTLLDFWIGQLRAAPVDAQSRDILRLGLYQILLIETAAHAAVFETVELAPARARGLINALLRRALREKDRLTSLADEQPLATRFSHPEFLVAKWMSQFGTEATYDLCRWNNLPAPVSARINSLKISAADFLGKYPGAVLLPGRENFVTLSEPADALRNGDCYIQDPSTVLACELLAPLPNETVLDACAAPGGKSSYLAAMMQNSGSHVAADRDDLRLERLRGNLTRLGVANATIVRCDWREPESIRAAQFQPQSFHRILLDVPCSNTGVMRRRVDLRWRLRPNEFATMQAQQLAILENVAPLLKPGGSLVYSTCSLEPEENEEVIDEFLAAHLDFCLTESQRSHPIRDGFDGAYAARLHRPVVVE